MKGIFGGEEAEAERERELWTLESKHLKRAGSTPRLPGSSFSHGQVSPV